MKIYPNPSRTTAYISIPSKMKTGGKLTVTNSEGDTICRNTFDENQFQLIPLDLTDQPNGFYKITLENDLHTECNELLNLANVDCPVLV